MSSSHLKHEPSRLCFVPHISIFESLKGYPYCIKLFKTIRVYSNKAHMVEVKPPK